MDQSITDDSILKVYNFKQHPTNPHYQIFHFRDISRSSQFEELLKKAEIPFEKDEEGNQSNDDLMVLYAVRNRYFKKAKELNFIILGQHRKRTIPNRFISISLVVITFGIILLGIISYFINTEAR